MHETRHNNFDLIRVAAATQVVVTHAVHHLNIQLPTWAEYPYDFLKAFPGVSIFFAISGYLVTISCQRNPLNKYAVNRALRIFPLLWVSSALLLLYLFLSSGASVTALLTWFFGQVTILQYYTPAELRSLGVGAPNGSLWTIPIEIQFYCALPIILAIYKRVGSTSILLLTFGSILTHNLVSEVSLPEVLIKVIECSILTQFPFFALGIITAIHREKTERFFSGKFTLFTLAYFAWWVPCRMVTGSSAVMSLGDPFTLIGAPLLVAVVLSAAFTCREASAKILRGNDISYGIYVIHGPIINVLVQGGVTQPALALSTLFGATLLLAMLSWRFLEKPALSMRSSFFGVR